MSGRAWASVVGLVLALVAVLPAAAIVKGEPDGTRHPYVGLVAFYDEDGGYLHRCSGSLISPTVLLTAAHCTFETASAQVWFDPELAAHPREDPPGGTTGAPHTHPGFDDFATFPDTSDVGIVVLDEPVRLEAYAQLPEQGDLDGLARRRGRQDVSFTAVGYGLQAVEPREQADLIRMRATLRLVNLGSALTDGYNLGHSGGVGTGGATCFGDSGGPILRGDGDVVVAVTSFGPNPTCLGAGFAYRIDTATSLEWIRDFL